MNSLVCQQKKYILAVSSFSNNNNNNTCLIYERLGMTTIKYFKRIFKLCYVQSENLAYILSHFITKKKGCGAKIILRFSDK